MAKAAPTTLLAMVTELCMAMAAFIRLRIPSLSIPPLVLFRFVFPSNVYLLDLLDKCLP